MDEKGAEAEARESLKNPKSQQTGRPVLVRSIVWSTGLGPVDRLVNVVNDLTFFSFFFLFAHFLNFLSSSCPFQLKSPIFYAQC